MVLIVMISITPAVDYYVSNRNWSIIFIFTTSIGLLFHQTLISFYLFGSDIHIEYYFANLSNQRSIWLPKHPPDILNSLLSLGVYPTTISRLTQLDLVWILKGLYPFYLAFIPLVLFLLWEDLFGYRARWGAYLLVLNPTYFTTVPNAFRQGLAEIILASLFLITFQNGAATRTKKLIIFFLIAIVTFHYGVSYYLLLAIFPVLLVSTLVVQFRTYLPEENIWPHLPRWGVPIILFYPVVLALWYIYTSQGTIFTLLVTATARILTNIGKVFSPDSSRGTQFVTEGFTDGPIHLLTKYLNFASIGIVLIGLIIVLYQVIRSSQGSSPDSKFEFNNIPGDYLLLGLVTYTFSIATVILPFVALGVGRIYHLSMFILAPFYSAAISIGDKSRQIGIVLICLLLLLNLGIIFEFTPEPSESKALNSDTVHQTTFTDSEYRASKWIKSYTENPTIYADRHGLWKLSERFYGDVHTVKNSIKKGSLMFLTTNNLDTGKFILLYYEPQRFERVNIANFSFISTSCTIYSSGGAVIKRTC
ncbi:DUF2206 domain-containing protein [Halobellus sp. EA9]|uniref:DUF2206 domain-containing protein n=1 Tax=Halobellus sp. EA9 TaxID=3421647 RepID=UPI003EBC3227